LKKSAALDCEANGVHPCFNLFAGDDPKSPKLSNVHFIKLELRDADGKLVSENFYWNAKEVWRYQDLTSMSKVKLSGEVKKALEGDTCRLTVKVRNPSGGVALTVRLKVVDPATRLLVAPILYSENYFSLTPGESREIAVEYRTQKVLGKEAKVMLEGWNVDETELA
jgi:hypothetical protein